MTVFKYKLPEEKEIPVTGGVEKKQTLTPGVSAFKVTGGFTKSKDGTPLVTKDKGYPYLRLNLDVTDCKGVTDSISDIFTVNMGWKVESLLKSIDMEHLNDGDLNLELIKGCKGSCMIDLDGTYGMVVKKYLKPGKGKKEKEDYSKQLVDDSLDDLPF